MCDCGTCPASQSAGRAADTCQVCLAAKRKACSQEHQPNTEHQTSLSFVSPITSGSSCSTAAGRRWIWGGWLLDDEADVQATGPSGSAPYVIPPGILIEPGGFHVFYGRMTGVVPNNDGDVVRLLGRDGALLESFACDRATYNGPWSRTVDGAGHWTQGYAPWPGGPSMPPPATATPTITPTRASTQGSASKRIRISVETARHKYAGTRVLLEGQVTVPPPLFRRSIYIQDHTGGILVSLYPGGVPTAAGGGLAQSARAAERLPRRAVGLGDRFVRPAASRERPAGAAATHPQH